MGRHRIVLALVAAVAMTFLSLAPSAPQASAEPQKPRTPITALTGARLATTMSVSAQPGDQTHMVITGRLVDQVNRPVGGAPILVRIDGTVVAATHTSGSGSFRVRAPVPGPGAHQAEALFAGQQGWGGSSATAPFIVQGSAATTQASTQPPAARPTGSGTTLTATAAPNPVSLGGTVTITGTLVGPRGPVGSAQVDAHIDWGESSGSAVTGDDGGYSLSLPLPDSGQPPQQVAVKVTYAGESGLPPASADLSVPVNQTVTSPTPTAEPSVSAEPSSSQAQAAAVVTTPSTTPAGSARQAGSSILTSVGITVGAVALVSLAALVTLCVVAFGGQRLRAGERRGFGSDFGQKPSHQAMRQD